MECPVCVSHGGRGGGAKPFVENRRDRRHFVNGIRSRNEIQEWTSYFVTAPKLARRQGLLTSKRARPA